MKVLILGGTGVISSAITQQLLRRGDIEVTLFNRGKSERRFEGDVKTLRGNRYDYLPFVQQMQEAQKAEGGFDTVIEMIGYGRDDAESLVEAFGGRISQVIFCSTVDVYAKPYDFYPVTEAHRLEGRNDYARNKVLCERVLRNAAVDRQFALTILRPAHTYGEGSGLIHSMGWSSGYLDRLRKGKPIIVHGDGQSLWSSCHVDDVARAFVNAVGNPKATGRCYHLTGEEWIPWNRYHETVTAAMGWQLPKLVHIPTDLLVRLAQLRAGVCYDNFQFNNIFDNTAAHTDLGFRYTVPFAEGVRRTVTYLEERGLIADCEKDPLDDAILAAWEKHCAAMQEELRR